MLEAVEITGRREEKEEFERNKKRSYGQADHILTAENLNLGVANLLYALVGKVPGLGSIPILGELFKSRAFQEKSTELVIFVTPYLIDPDSKRNQDMLDYSRQLNKEATEDMKFSIFD